MHLLNHAMRRQKFSAVNARKIRSYPEWCSMNAVLRLLRTTKFDGDNTNFILSHHVMFAGHQLRNPNNDHRFMYIVHSGVLKNERNNFVGEPYVVGFLRVGDVIGLENFDLGLPEVHTTAITNCLLVKIPINTVLKIIRECYAFEEGLYRILSEYIAVAQQRHQSHVKLKAPARVARFLMEELERQSPRSTSDAGEIVFLVRRRDIASYLGLRIETICRMLAEFEEKGILIREKQGITIISRKLLDRVACAPENWRSFEPVRGGL